MAKQVKQLPAGFTLIDSTTSGPRVSVYNGKVYLFDEDGRMYLCGEVVVEPSSHEWTERDGEFKESATSLADRLSENEQFGFSSHLEDSRYMELSAGERVCDKCWLVTPSAVCGNCE